MNRQEEIHRMAMSFLYEYPHLCNEEDHNFEYVRKLEDIAEWADETMIEKVYNILVGEYSFTDKEAKDFIKKIKI